MGQQHLQLGIGSVSNNQKLSGMMLSIFILVLLAVTSANAECKANSGDTCKTKSQMPTWFGGFFASGDPCFDYKGRRMCFFDHPSGKNYITPCDPNKSGCGGGEGGSGEGGGDDGGNSGPTCDKADERTKCDDSAAYCSLSEKHTMCKYCGTNMDQCGKVCARGITDQADKDAIVAKHNELRRKVAKGEETKGLNGQAQPSATDMNELKWNDELAEIAQRWADQCTWGHSKQDKTSQYWYVGQNMAFGASSSGPPSDPGFANFVQRWYNEVSDWPAANVAKWSKAGVPAGKMIGHYTQTVWGATKEVGCGYVSFNNPEHSMSHGGKYPFMRFLICNYGMGGNFNGSPMYTVGPTATDCKNGSNDGLCTW